MVVLVKSRKSGRLIHNVMWVSVTLPRHTVYNFGGGFAQFPGLESLPFRFGCTGSSFIPLIHGIHIEGTRETILTMMVLIVIARSEGHLISFGGSDVTASSRTRTIPVSVGGQILESDI